MSGASTLSSPTITPADNGGGSSSLDDCNIGLPMLSGARKAQKYMSAALAGESSSTCRKLSSSVMPSESG